MKNYFLIFLLSVCFTPFLVIAQPGAQTSNTISSQAIADKLDVYLDAATKADKFNGLVLIARKGEVLLEKGYGLKHVQDSLPNTGQTIYQIGSNTKPFTATLVLQLAEQGKLSVYDKINKYFPDYPGGDKITIEHLLTHTSGIADYTQTDEFLSTDESEAINSVSKSRIIHMFKDKSLAFKPGKKYSYSNSNYYLLGCIIEKVTGKAYEQVMKESIFQPLAMSTSGFDFIHLQNPDKATGYTNLSRTDQNIEDFPLDSTISYAAGGMYSTVDDLYKWSRAISTGKLLSQKTWQQAFTPYKSYYGYGWIKSSIHSRKIIAHSGGIKGFSSHYVWFPAEDVVIILLSNVFKETVLGPVTTDLAAIIFNEPYTLPKKHQEVTLPASALQPFTGVYKYMQTSGNKSKNITISLEQGGLIVRKAGEPDFKLYAESSNYFFYKTIEAEMEFIKDRNGKVEKMIIHQNGEQYVWKKIE